MGIRPYRPADAQATLELCRRAISQTAAADYTSAQIEAWLPGTDTAAWATRVSQGPDGSPVDVCVAELEGGIAGFASLTAAGQIDLLYVDPSHSRRGIGTNLIGHLLGLCRSCGHRTCKVEASSTLRPLLERLGFTLIETQRVTRRGVVLENHLMSFDLMNDATADISGGDGLQLKRDRKGPGG